MPSPTGVVTQPSCAMRLAMGSLAATAASVHKGCLADAGKRQVGILVPHPKQSHDNHLRYLPVRRLGQAFQQRHARFVRLTIWLACLPTSVPVSCHASPGRACMYVLWYWVLTSLPFAREVARRPLARMHAGCKLTLLPLPSSLVLQLTCICLRRRSCCAPMLPAAAR